MLQRLHGNYICHGIWPSPSDSVISENIFSVQMNIVGNSFKLNMKEHWTGKEWIWNGIKKENQLGP